MSTRALLARGWLRAPLVSLLASVLLPGTAMATPLVEHFRDLGTLVQDANGVYALSLPGWFARNNSQPRSPDGGLLQGVPAFFAAFGGTEPEYAALVYTAVDGEGEINLFLVTPRVDFAPGQLLSFWFQSANTPAFNFPDRMQVRLSTAPDSGTPDVGTDASSVGTFTTLLLDINPTQGTAFTTCPQDGFRFSASGSVIPGTIPETWCRVIIEGVALPASGSGRLAFRYVLSGAGADTNFGSLVGLDDFSFGDQLLGNGFD